MNFSQKCKTGQFLSYKVNGDKTVEVSQGRDNKPTGKLEIPASVTYKGKEYAVTSIGFWAFSGCSGLTSITIPNSVTSIEQYAFEGCIGLTCITIGASVTSIGVGAFRGCEELTSITIPNFVTSIGEETFCGCSRLTEITIPNSVTSIGEWAFDGCRFTSIDVAADNPRYKSIEGVLYSKDEKTLIYYPKGKKGSSFTIPDSVTSIEEEAFSDCEGLTSVTIPNSVTSIGEGAFLYCKGLTSIAIPDSVTSIGFGAFYGCDGLTSITIPNSVTSIGMRAFYGCEGLTSVTIPNSVTSIGKEAFCGCSRLTEITIPNSVTSIGEWAFDGCRFTSIDVAADNPRYKSIEGVLYSKDEKTLIYYPKGKKGSSFTIPDSVTSIEEEAFSDCEGLTSITIPDSVTSIGMEAFSGCSGLTSITIPNSVTSIGVRAFRGCEELTSIDVAADNPNYKSIDGVLYDKDVTTFICCPAGKQGSITIPNSVTSIGVRAFYECKRLTSITIPDSVTSIGEEAFYCTGLTEITCKAVVPPTIEEETFAKYRREYFYDLPLYVPAKSVEAYKKADYWKEFKDIKPLK